MKQYYSNIMNIVNIAVACSGSVAYVSFQVLCINFIRKITVV